MVEVKCRERGDIISRPRCHPGMTEARQISSCANMIVECVRFGAPYEQFPSGCEALWRSRVPDMWTRGSSFVCRVVNSQLCSCRGGADIVHISDSLEQLIVC